MRSKWNNCDNRQEIGNFIFSIFGDIFPTFFTAFNGKSLFFFLFFHCLLYLKEIILRTERNRRKEKKFFLFFHVTFFLLLTFRFSFLFFATSSVLGVTITDSWRGNFHLFSSFLFSTYFIFVDISKSSLTQRIKIPLRENCICISWIFSLFSFEK